jgi:hypothetical protein
MISVLGTKINNASADIINVSVDRYIQAEADAYYGGTERDSDKNEFLGSWLSDVNANSAGYYENIFREANAIAYQDSNIVHDSSLMISAQGNASAHVLYGDFGQATSESTLVVDFSLTEDYQYSLNINGLYSEGGVASAHLWESSGIGDIFSHDYDGRGTPYIYSSSGALSPGDYTLFLHIYSNSGSEWMPCNSSYDVTFSVNPVPIPSAFWMLGSGIVGIVGLRKKLKR